MSNKTVYFNWSSGKDSALALYHLLEDRNYSVDYLVTSMSTQYNRVSMHGLRRELLQEQLNSIGIEYGTVEFPDFPSNDIYEQVMGGKVQELKSKGFEYAAFGDIFLEDLKQYRESKLALLGIKALFP
ncbi:MAG TPA: ATP-binding protein, partial [Parasegetibacter sp.]